MILAQISVPETTSLTEYKTLYRLQPPYKGDHVILLKMASDTLDGDKYDNSEKGRERDEDAGGNNDGPRETTQSSNDSMRLQDAISSTINLREAGNKVFHAGHYEFSTNIYEYAAYKSVYLKGLQQ